MTKSCLLLILLIGINIGYSLQNGNKLRNIDWWASGQKELQKSLESLIKGAKAKNVIFFLGDGMGVTTITAARALKAQQNKKSLHETKLAWDDFPYTSIAKTYNVDALTPDSAGTATAYLTGCKTNKGVIGGNDKVMKYNCSSTKGNNAESILHHAHKNDKWTGVVTTTRVTHATPAASYGLAASRTWECDSDIPPAGWACKDLAKQLVEENDFIKVILGGGRQKFTTRNERDLENPQKKGHREDGRNLMKEWEKKQTDKVGANKVKLVIDQEGFDLVDPSKVEYLMGLFEPSHMQYVLDKDKDIAGEPTLAEMTEKAIKMLQKSKNGYFLFVEGGRIDHGHHGNKAHKALTETIAFSEAVEKAMSMTDIEDTLIIVTADHSHVFTMSGYASPENDILGLSRSVKRGTMDELELDYMSDGLPYLTLAYTNGLGYNYHRTEGKKPVAIRRNLTQDEADGILWDRDFRQDSSMPRRIETHSGEDVVVFARGPNAALFHGTQEQNFIAHAVMYALDVTPKYNNCKKPAFDAVVMSRSATISSHIVGLVSWTLILLLGLL